MPEPSRTERFREWLADAWCELAWQYRTRRADLDRRWWYLGRKVCGPGPQSTLIVTSGGGWMPMGQRIAVEDGTPHPEIVRVIRVDRTEGGHTIVVEPKKSWRWKR